MRFVTLCVIVLTATKFSVDLHRPVLLSSTQIGDEDFPLTADGTAGPTIAGNTATQNITIIKNKKSYPVRSQTWTVTAPGAGSFGHGTIINNITSPGSGSDVNKSR